MGRRLLVNFKAVPRGPAGASGRARITIIKLFIFNIMSLQNPAMTDRFRYYLRVRYAECDAQKVVFNARYADYVDLSTSEFLRALGFGEALVDGTLDYQLVKQTVE